MAVRSGYIRIWRSIEHCDVFHDDWLFRLWVWCLLKANYRERKFAGTVVQVGSFVTAMRRAAESLKASKNRVHRGLVKLESLGMISQKTGRNLGRKFTVVTICNWETYQKTNSKLGTTVGTEVGQGRDKSGTERRRVKKDKEGKESLTEKFRKPDVAQVRAYCLERQNGIDPEAFVNHYEAVGWMIGKSKMKDWKRAVLTWEAKRKQATAAVVTEPVMCRLPTDEEFDAWRPG